MNFEAFSDDQLRAEIKRRADIRLAEAEAKRVAYNELVAEHAAVLLQFVPNHTRSGCSDDHIDLWNGCARCALFDSYGYTDEGTFEVEVMFYPKSDR